MRPNRRFNMAGGVWREQPNKQFGLRRLVLFFIAFALGYGLFLYIGKEKVSVTLLTAARKDVPVYLASTGTVQAYNSVTVRTQIEGQLAEILFREGQDVHKGDVLARLDPRTYQAQYEKAVANKEEDEAQLEALKRQHTHSSGSAKNNAGSGVQLSTLHQFESAVKSDQAAIDAAKTLLSYATIASPINGRTGIRQVDVGNIVHPTDANGLVVITQMEPISVLFSLPQQKLAEVGAQTNAKNQLPKKLKVLAMDSENRRVQDIGELELVDNHIDQGTGTIRLKAVFPNAKRLLWPGGGVGIRLQVGIRPNAVVVPASAVQHTADGTYVFILKPSGDAVAAQPVKVAMIEGPDAVIEEGVKPGDQVVVESRGAIKNGSHVEVNNTADTVKKADAAQPKPPAVAAK